MAINMVKLPTQKQDLVLRVAKGHFATSHSHINYYIDVTMQKTRLSEARAVALELVSSYTHTTIVDTILCLDGTEVIGACMASELTRDGYVNMNAHQTIYVVTPEHTTGSQLLFRENTSPHDRGQTCADPGSIRYHRLYRAGCCGSDQLLRRPGSWHWRNLCHPDRVRRLPRYFHL